MKNLLIISLFLFSSQSFANWTGATKIVSMYHVNDDQVILNLANGANPSACKVSSAGQILINPNTQKALFSMFLSAYMSGKSVTIYTSGNCLTTHWADQSFNNVGHAVFQ